MYSDLNKRKKFSPFLLIWKTQLDHLTNVLSRAAGIMYKLRRILPEHTKTQIYFSLVYSRLLYGIETWGAAARSNFDQIQRLQNSIIKSIYCKPRLFPTLQLFRLSNKFIPIRAIYECAVLMLSHKIKHDVLRTNLSFRESSSNYSRRVPYLLEMPSRVNTEYGRRRISYVGPSLYNSLIYHHRNDIQLGILNQFNLSRFRNLVRAFVNSKLGSYF